MDSSDILGILISKFDLAERKTSFSYSWSEDNTKGSCEDEGNVIDYRFVDGIGNLMVHICYNVYATRIDRKDEGDNEIPDSWVIMDELVDVDIDVVVFNGDEVDLTLDQRSELSELIKSKITIG